MNFALAAALLTLTPALWAQLPCTLDESDLSALAQSPSKLTAEQADRLSPHEQQLLCSSRDMARTVTERGQPDTQKEFTPNYLSADEYDRVNFALNSIIENRLKASGFLGFSHLYGEFLLHG